MTTSSTHRLRPGRSRTGRVPGEPSHQQPQSRPSDLRLICLPQAPTMNDTLLDYLTAAALALLLTWGLVEYLTV